MADVVRDRLVRWGVPDRKITVIPNGLDCAGWPSTRPRGPRVREQFGIGPDDYVIGVLGRLDPNKRFDLVIEAAAPLLGDGCKLLIVGSGEERRPAGGGGRPARGGRARHLRRRPAD